ncbi:GTP cyclohydrolase I FolE [Vagococcus bubulae]|uniref:GTP cyclohydrolase 1 n=1 Tax=Vagococcus bubulae TaxID=1977868 RepID=A0A429ZF01_9ENTE|nr:GTP cyclohydrolase I FolE [Vagococcus bubulae]RST92235.1 GTP cyclohydrolase I FolE [Vagococcus bubulae]
MEQDKQLQIEEAVKTILTAIGEDIDRDGLKETPKRVAKMYAEVFSSVREKEFTNYKVFPSLNEDDMVLVKDIEFYSMCEHHLLPFFGKAHVAYIPSDNKVLGLSKVARMVDFCAKRPNVQEDLTIQIANLINEKVKTKGVAVSIEAEHMCMAMRGVKARGSVTKTFHYQGVFKEDKDVKNDFLRALD